jgi:hypothetical protein
MNQPVSSSDAMIYQKHTEGTTNGRLSIGPVLPVGIDTRKRFTLPNIEARDRCRVGSQCMPWHLCFKLADRRTIFGTA